MYARFSGTHLGKIACAYVNKNFVFLVNESFHIQALCKRYHHFLACSHTKIYSVARFHLH